MSFCGKCGKQYFDYPALSRKDNKTEICSICALKEALEELEEKDEYIQDLEEECENLSEYNRLLVERIKE